MGVWLRSVYEQGLGASISDRTWLRVKKTLRIYNEYDDGRVAVVTRAAHIRKANPSAKLDLAEISFQLNAEKIFPVDVGSVQGSELYRMICETVGYEVPRQTVYRWGKDINCLFSMRRFYQRPHLVLWAMKLFPYYQPVMEAS